MSGCDGAGELLRLRTSMGDIVACSNGPWIRDSAEAGREWALLLDRDTVAGHSVVAALDPQDIPMAVWPSSTREAQAAWRSRP